MKIEIKTIDELGIVVEDGDRGKNYPKKSEFIKGGYCPFLNNKEINDGLISLENPDCITKKRHDLLNRGTVNDGDIVITTRGTIGNIGIFRPTKKFKFARINSGMVILKNNSSNINNEFLFYALKTPFVKKQIENATTGTTQQQLTLSDIKRVKIHFPNQKQQEKIVATISSLDKKIELNNQINQKLEELAQTLYQQWFVAFEFPNAEGKPYRESGGKMVESELGMIPKGWGIVRLNELFDFQKGTEIGNSEYLTEKKENSKRFIRVGDLENENSNTFTILNIDEKYNCNENDLLISLDGSVGKINYGLNGIISSGIRKAKFQYIEEKAISLPFCFLSDFKIQRSIKRLSTGSIIKHFGNNAKNIKIAVPSNKELFKQFNDTVEKYFELIINNKKENIKLIKLRDTLLPYLMNGKISIK